MILAVIIYICDSKVFILGINLGWFGFLASIEKKCIYDVIKLFKCGMYSIQECFMFYLEFNLFIFGEICFVLNDIMLFKWDIFLMIIIYIFINGVYFNFYWVDGIIVVILMGFIGYFLSCGGFIIFFNFGNFVFIFVVLYNFNVWLIVILESFVILFEIEGWVENFFCMLDFCFEMIMVVYQLAVCKNDFGICLVQFYDVSFMDIIW